MNGVGGKPAWAWIFSLEGPVTVVPGALSFWIIMDFPDNAKFVTEEERTVVIRRLQGDNRRRKVEVEVYQEASNRVEDIHRYVRIWWC